MISSPPTRGESRVRSSFNPSGHTQVDEIKTLAAEMIDYCDRSLKTVNITNSIGAAEEARLWALAMTAFEEGAMWAVKAATFPRPPQD